MKKRATEVRKIIRINEDLCDGCSKCIPSCPEQAIRLVETPRGPKARLVKEFYCDGLGACLGACPTGALVIEERRAEVYDEEATLARIKREAPEMLEEHRRHMREHEEKPSPARPPGVSACPSSRSALWDAPPASPAAHRQELKSELRNWPVQLHLVSPEAPYWAGADVVFAADCAPFGYAGFHQDFLKGKVVAIGCPKLDDVEAYLDKVTRIFEAGPRSVTVVHMEVPCCFGLVRLVREAQARSGKKIPVETAVIGVRGERLG
ncbi:MAG TPA: 4Fe-4S binding protein [Elusimicrobiota bacterium]|nr:4Fe-4S binding protein [Elusimicrobiota bacterium]